MDLDDLGQRICILGPSNSGKSTLAAAVGRVRSLPVIHLDQYRHLPGTQWVERPDDEFELMHDEVVRTDRWVIDGNYSRWLSGSGGRRAWWSWMPRRQRASSGTSAGRSSNPTAPGAWRALATVSAWR